MVPTIASPVVLGLCGLGLSVISGLVCLEGWHSPVARGVRWPITAALSLVAYWSAGLAWQALTALAFSAVY